MPLGRLCCGAVRPGPFGPGPCGRATAPLAFTPSSGSTTLLHFAAPTGGISPLITKTQPISIGKYLVSPLSRPLDDGGYRASVSIRSGQGSASTDRVMRFVGRFDSARAAQRYARAQGLIWVAEARAMAA